MSSACMATQSDPPVCAAVDAREKRKGDTTKKPGRPVLCGRSVGVKEESSFPIQDRHPIHHLTGDTGIFGLFFSPYDERTDTTPLDKHTTQAISEWAVDRVSPGVTAVETLIHTVL